MTTPDAGFSALLGQLDNIANAPMTDQERALRANSLLGDSIDPGDLARATSEVELPWNTAKASQHGVPTHVWLRAVATVGLPTSTTAAELLERLHRADAVTEMLKAGYVAGVDPLGSLTWRARG